MSKRLLSALLASAICPAAAAEVFVAEAPVVKVIPLHTEVTREPCPSVKPSTDDLIAILRWDLCKAPPTRNDTVTRYRIYYEWDDQLYERVVNTHPGATIPIRVHLD